MIFKFPALPEENKPALRKWLETQRHQYLEGHHKYAACGNEEEALKHKHYAACFTYILMMEEYHTEEPESSSEA
jgi:hypothetical protein